LINWGRIPIVQKGRITPAFVSAITICYHLCMNTKHRKTLMAIFARPTSASIVFADIEALVKALGGFVYEREGSRVRIELNGEQWRCHRPHPGKEAKRYQVESP
jgi:HicA toxin of bacterial toxin-antitoxin,